MQDEHERASGRASSASMSASAASRGEATSPGRPSCAPVGEGLQAVVGVDRRPAERQARDACPRAACSPAGEHQRRPWAASASSVRRPARRPAAGSPRPRGPARQRGDAAAQQLVLLGRRQRVPALVAPAVQPDLVAGGRDVAQRLGIELGVEALDEEGRAQVQRGERLQRARSPTVTDGSSPMRRRAVPRSRSAASPRLSKLSRTASRSVAAHAGSPFATGATGVDAGAPRGRASRRARRRPTRACARNRASRRSRPPTRGWPPARRGGAGRRCAPTHDRRSRARRPQPAPRGRDPVAVQHDGEARQVLGIDEAGGVRAEVQLHERWPAG